MVKKYLVVSVLVSGITGPYYLGYDCIDSCCDRVPQCGKLPGTMSSEETRQDLIQCLDAVPKDCYVTARIGFIAAGFDVYQYLVAGYEDSNMVGSGVGVSFEDWFRVFPEFKADVHGYIHSPDYRNSCNIVTGSVLYGHDTKSYTGRLGLPDEDGPDSHDLAVSMWVEDEDKTADGAVFGFDASWLSPYRSHLIFTVDSDMKAPAACTLPIAGDDGLGIWVAVTGLVHNIRKHQVIPETFRLGEPPLPTPKPKIPTPQPTQDTSTTASLTTIA